MRIRVKRGGRYYGSKYKKVRWRPGIRNNYRRMNIRKRRR